MYKISVLLLIGLVPFVASQIVGGPVEAGANDTVINSMAAFAVGEIGAEYELVNVISGTKQVVNGMMYNIHLEARRKGTGKLDKKRRCNVLVYEIPHQNYKELEEFKCHFSNKESRL